MLKHPRIFHLLRFGRLQQYTVIRITFDPDEDEGGNVNDVAAPIAIVDDLINEATEQAGVCCSATTQQ